MKIKKVLILSLLVLNMASCSQNSKIQEVKPVAMTVAKTSQQDISNEIIYEEFHRKGSVLTASGRRKTIEQKLKIGASKNFRNDIGSDVWPILKGYTLDGIGNSGSITCITYEKNNNGFDVKLSIENDCRTLISAEGITNARGEDLGKQSYDALIKLIRQYEQTSNFKAKFDFNGLEIRLLFTEAGKNEAIKINERLKSFGAKTVVLGPFMSEKVKEYIGKIYAKSGYEEKAKSIAECIADLQQVRIERHRGSSEQPINLWIGN